MLPFILRRLLSARRLVGSRARCNTLSLSLFLSVFSCACVRHWRRWCAASCAWPSAHSGGFQVASLETRARARAAPLCFPLERASECASSRRLAHWPPREPRPPVCSPSCESRPGARAATAAFCPLTLSSVCSTVCECATYERDCRCTLVLEQRRRCRRRKWIPSGLDQSAWSLLPPVRWRGRCEMRLTPANILA